MTYELRWKSKDIKKSAELAAAPARKTEFKNIQNKRKKKIEELKKQMSAEPKKPDIITEPI